MSTPATAADPHPELAAFIAAMEKVGAWMDATMTREDELYAAFVQLRLYHVSTAAAVMAFAALALMAMALSIPAHPAETLYASPQAQVRFAAAGALACAVAAVGLTAYTAYAAHTQPVLMMLAAPMHADVIRDLVYASVAGTGAASLAMVTAFFLPEASGGRAAALGVAGVCLVGSGIFQSILSIDLSGKHITPGKTVPPKKPKHHAAKHHKPAHKSGGGFCSTFSTQGGCNAQSYDCGCDYQKSKCISNGV